MMYLKLKRGADVLLSLVVLLLSAPVLAISALLIRLETSGPAFFLQERIGRHGKVFKIVKLRTMVQDAESNGTGVYSYKDDPRVTKVGRFLRKTSIDELPQVINILKGDMSFIGMRPPLTYHPCKFEEYSMRERQMFNLRPGITGWAQVQGRNALEWQQRIEYNIWYQEHVSLMLDVKIFFKTFAIVLGQKNSIVEQDTAFTFQTAQADNKAKP